MARQLDQILAELNAVYAPQKDIYNAQIAQLDPQMQAEQQGLDQIKTNSFQGITDQANRRGLLFSGIPIQEQAQYLGGTYLPSVANLKSRYAQQKFNLQDAIAQIGQRQYNQANDIYQTELGREAAARAAGSGGGGWTPSTFGSEVGATPAVQQPQLTLRQQWQREANQGDWNAQVALNYAGDDGRYDGPVNSRSEYDVLKAMGIQGNYYYQSPGGGGGGW